MTSIHSIDVSSDGYNDVQLFSSKRTAIEYGLAVYKQYLMEECLITFDQLPSFPFTEPGLEKMRDYCHKKYTGEDFKEILGEEYDMYDEPSDVEVAPPHVSYIHRTLNNTSGLSRTVFNMMDKCLMIRERGFDWTLPERRKNNGK